MLVALLRPKKLGLILGPIGAKLVYRGVSGHSLIYKMLGTNRGVHDEQAAISVPHQQGIRVVGKSAANGKARNTLLIAVLL